jgi:hypothetical protein
MTQNSFAFTIAIMYKQLAGTTEIGDVFHAVNHVELEVLLDVEIRASAQIGRAKL